MPLQLNVRLATSSDIDRLVDLDAIAKRKPKRRAFTSTNASNEPMQKLLGKFGFIESGHVENLDEGDPEIIFVKFYPSSR